MRTLRVLFWLFGLLLLSGAALRVWYAPVAAASPGGGSSAVSAASITRGVHFWLAQIALLAALAAVGQAFFVKTNRSRAGWAAGMFVLTALLWFTGMLLPWDQLDHWLSPLFHPPMGLWAVYWLHTLILSLSLLALLIPCIRRLRSTHHETHS